MIALALVLSLLAFLHFVFCSRGYYRELSGWPRSAFDFWLLQSVAWGFLLVSIIPCVLRWGFEIGLTIWFGLITVSALLVAVAVNYAWPLVSSLWRWSLVRVLLFRKC